MQKNNKFLDNNRIVLAVSLIVAIIIWGYVIVFQNNSYSTTISNVEIDLNYSQNNYENLGLDVVSMSVNSVNVKISGARGVVAEVSKEDIVVYPYITGIDSAGNYEFALTAENLSPLKDYSIDSLSTDSVIIYLDKIITKEIPITIDLSNIAVAEEFLVGVSFTNPQTISITGPEYKVETVTQAVAKADRDYELSQTTSMPANLKLYDELDTEISKELLTFSNEEVEITVPVLKELILPVVVEYTNVPKDFDTSIFNLNLSPTQVNVAVPANVATSVDEYVAGYINIEEIEFDKDYLFEITYPEGYLTLDTNVAVRASISQSNISFKTIDVTQITIINDANEEIELLTQEINSVTVVGTTSAIDSLSGTDVIAQIDASKISLTQGTQTVSVDFVIPSSNEVFVKGDYTVTVRK